MMFLLSLAWWQYLLIVIGLLVIVVAYLLYKGYSKIRAAPLKGIPYPPMTSILGHAEKMIHDLKHEFRLEVANTFPHPLHQLVISSQSSVFVNDPLEVGNVLREVPTKGRIYGAFRYDPRLPDILACDFETFSLRKQILGPAYEALEIPADSSVVDNLLKVLKSHADDGNECNIGDLFTAFSLDIICESAFEYKLDAMSGSKLGQGAVASLRTMEAKRASIGIFADSTAPKISEEELAVAQESWRSLLRSLFAHIKARAVEKGTLEPAGNLGDALLQLAANDSGITEAEMLSEIHQTLRHGHQAVAGSLFWLAYVICKHRKVRDRLEGVDAQEGLANYVECVIKETLRRYPVAGNMTVRTPHSEPLQLMGRFSIPAGTPIFLHMFSHHNSAMQWHKPTEFLPERWGVDAAEVDRPTCPFLSSFSAGDAPAHDSYDGVGFEPGALSYYPFSAGHRKCLGKSLALQVMRTYLLQVASKFRLSFREQSWDFEDPGKSTEAVIVPRDPRSYRMKVKELASGGEDQNEEVQTAAAEAEDDGWADDTDE